MLSLSGISLYMNSYWLCYEYFGGFSATIEMYHNTTPRFVNQQQKTLRQDNDAQGSREQMMNVLRWLLG